MEFENTIKWLALIRGPSFTFQQLQYLTQLLPDLWQIFQLSNSQLNHYGMTQKQQEYLGRINWQELEREALWMQSQQIKMLSMFCLQYPDLLKQIHKPPIALMVKGQISALNETQFAFVGSRSPSPYGINVAKKFAQALAQTSALVTSGLAIGIDGVAHQACLDAGGNTVAVMGAGFRHIYPKRHRTLAERITLQGALISEFYPTTAPIHYNFPKRNRVISGLSNGVVVIEAAIKSGSLVTAKYAIDQGRDVFAVPGNIFNPLSAGNHLLIKQGAKLVENLDDIIEDFIVTHKSSKSDQKKNLAESNLLASVDYDTTPIDVIIQRSNLPVEQVLIDLLDLEVQGFVAVVPGGYIRQA